jgi:hypothetical protein
VADKDVAFERGQAVFSQMLNFGSGIRHGKSTGSFIVNPRGR